MQRANKRILEEDSMKAVESRSGGIFDTKYIGIADKNGQLVGTSNNAKLTIVIDSNYDE